MSKAKILVVDDSPTQLKLAVESLEKEGYTVVTAADGEDALKVTQAEMPELILLDVIMPKLNGFKVCRKIKTSPKTKHIKVILCTSKGQESDKFWGKKQGADGYITKPYPEGELLENVAKML